MTLCATPPALTSRWGEMPKGTLAAFVAHAREVPSVVREEFADDLARLGRSEAMITVHTCHRVELYVALRKLGDRPLPRPPAGTRRLDDADAVLHLISVACGLDSAILGEDQILHQIRDALASHRAEQSLDPVLNRLFQVALHAGRRARDWFSGVHRSLGDVAIERVGGGAAPSGDRPILVVGAGTMGRLVVSSAARLGVRVLVTSRTPENAAVFASEADVPTVPFALDSGLPEVAGVIVALGGRWPVRAEAARQLAESGVTVVDLSSPPALGADLQAELGERFVSVDDLAWGPEIDVSGGLRDRLERLVDTSGGDYVTWLRTRDESLPAILELSRVADQRRRNELEWLNRKLPGLTDEERLLIEQMSNRLVAGLLHAPRTALNTDVNGNLGRAARELFGL